MHSKDRRKRVSASPLIDPTVCCVALLMPDQQAYASLTEPVRSRLERNLLALTTAARLIEVPVLVSYADVGTTVPYVPPALGHRHFASGAYPSPWLNPEFAAALTQEDRTALLIAGCWLEYQVLTTGLHALADAYDVYILSDATPAKTRSAAQSSRSRLMLQGARPVATSQVIHEWSLAATGVKRARLEALVDHLLQRQVPVDSGAGASP